MMRSNAKSAFAICLLPACFLAICPLSNAAEPESAVTYIERQLQSKAEENGRRMTAGSALRGIDINSHVEIEVKSDKMTTAVVQSLPAGDLTTEQRDILSRLSKLTSAASRTESLMLGFEQLFKMWDDATESRDFSAFNARRNAVAPALDEIINALGDAMQRRFMAAGQSAKTAEDRADEILDPIYSTAGYDWDAMQRLFDEEIRLVEAELANVADAEGLGLIIQAHLIIGPQQAVPIFLPGYNEVQTGPNLVYRKVRYEIPPETIALRDEYQEMAKEIGEARTAGEALQKLLKADYERNEQQIRALLAGVSNAVDEAEDALQNLLKWRDKTERDDWFNRVKNEVQGTPQGDRVISALTAVQQTVGHVEADVKALRAYANLGDSLRGTDTPDQALEKILSTFRTLQIPQVPGDTSSAGVRVLSASKWKERANEFTELMERIEELGPVLRDSLLAEDGPVAALQRLQPAAEKLLGEIEAVSSTAITTLFGFGSAEPINFAATLPQPVGETKLGLSPDADLDTQFDLKTIAESRNPDNQVWVTYKFFRGEEELTSPGWQDKFQIRVFGWQDHVTAGLAFVQQESAQTWQPTANLSWLLSKRKWPETGDNGLRGLGQPEWFSGFGLSTMPLDFDSNVDVELGVAATVSFMNDWVVAGYGVNMQTSTDNTYWFISLRLFKNQGMLK